MNYLQFPSIGEAYYEAYLANGLRVRVVPKPGFARRYAFVGIDFGSIDTQFTVDGRMQRVPDGIAHYLEHKMFDLPEGDAMRRFAETGASPNAFTSYAMTAYYFSCTERFDENLRLLLRMVTTPHFTAESVEKERGIIAQEIRMYEDSAASRVSEDMNEAMFAHHPVRVPIAGTVESIHEITPQMLNDCFEAFYRPDNMLLCVVGDIDAESVMQIAQELPTVQRGDLPVRDYGEAERMTPVSARTERRMEVSMPTFSIGFQCEGAAKGMDTFRQEIIGDLAAEILVGESSKLYRRLYEQGLIDADFSAGYESVKNACMLSASGDSDTPEQVLHEILAEADRIGHDGFDTELFERLKKSALGRRIRDLDSFESICYRMCAYEFDGADYFRFPEVYASVTKKDVQRFLKRVVCKERAVLSIVRPKKEGNER